MIGLMFTHRVSWHSLSCQPVTHHPTTHLLHHAQAFELSLNTFLLPLISSSCQIMEIKDPAAKQDTRCANFHVVALNSLPVRGTVTWLLRTYWRAETLHEMAQDSLLSVCNPELQNALKHGAFFSNTLLCGHCYVPRDPNKSCTYNAL